MQKRLQTIERIIAKVDPEVLERDGAKDAEGAESALDGGTEPRVEESRSDDGKMYIFEAIPDRDGKAVDLEVRINREAFVGRRIEVPARYVTEVKRLLTEGRFLFKEVASEK